MTKFHIIKDYIMHVGNEENLPAASFTINYFFNLERPNPGQSEKTKLNFYFHILFGASKGFMKALKRFEAPQRSVKIKI